MQNAGFAFLAAAFVLVVVFVGDVIISGDARHAYESDRTNTLDIERISPTTEDENTVHPIDDPLNFNIEDKDVLSTGERELMFREADYTYTIKDGDVIDDLARKYLGTNTLKSVLYDRNPHLSKGLKLEPGVQIVIPFSERR